jgi:uncharacterized membrane protein YbaN (DUF454 family)
LRLKVIVLTGLGFFFLGLGAVGLLLPVWPTTPFVLLSAACFSVSPQIKARIMRIAFFREHIENYEKRTGLSRKTLIISLSWLWGMLLLSIVLTWTLWIACLLLAIGTAVTTHILWMARDRNHEGEERERSKRVFGLFEVVFDLAYLIAALAIGVFLLATGAGNAVRMLVGAMAIILAGGDAFHLIPRMLAVLWGESPQLTRAMGLGKLVASLTMTVFYVLLWRVGQLIFNFYPGHWTTLLYFLALLRIVLCFLPQNRWYDPAPPVRWGVYRNIPFVIIGVMTAVLYGICAAGTPLRFMPLAIALSFAFYLPVVLFVHKNRMLGMLMLPKTCAYLWMLVLYLSL